MKDQLGRAYLKILKRHAPGVDAIGLSERLIEAAELIHDINTEEAGIADLPVDLASLGPVSREPREVRDEPRTSPPKIASPPPAQNAVVAAVSQSQRILLPSDPEFAQALAGQGLGLNGNKKIISASEIRRPVRRASNLPEVEYWSPADLIQTIIQNTPEELEIQTEDREGHPRKITVQRNTHNNAGLGTVTLTYKHASVTETDGFLTARHAFSVNTKDIDIEAAMENIKAQLGGMYQPKPASMEPQSGPDPGPLRLQNAAMIDRHEDRFEPGMNPGGHVYEREPVGEEKGRWHSDASVVVPKLRSSLSRQNDQLAPVGRRF